MSESKTSERRLIAHDREIRALELRRQAKSYPEIARELGYRSVSGAYDAVMGALHHALVEPAEQVRALELERIDDMLAAIRPRALKGDLKRTAQ